MRLETVRKLLPLVANMVRQSDSNSARKRMILQAVYHQAIEMYAQSYAQVAPVTSPSRPRTIIAVPGLPAAMCARGVGSPPHCISAGSTRREGEDVRRGVGDYCCSCWILAAYSFCRHITLAPQWLRSRSHARCSARTVESAPERARAK